MTALEDDADLFDCSEDDELHDRGFIIICKCMTCGKEYKTDLVYEDFEYICPECDEALNKE
jgi:NAD-dependent SIR2 family protein deacetylase